MPKETPSQTAGPYLHIGLAPSTAGFMGPSPEIGLRMADWTAPGQRIRVTGTMLDGAGAPVTDALIEIWQADPEGRYHGATQPGLRSTVSGFRGFGRVVTDDDGSFRIDTLKPGPVAGPAGSRQAPHLSLWIVARGINIGLSTRLYFADETAANRDCPALARVPEARRATLLAEQVPDLPGHYRFPIRLQGEAETVFFDI